MASSPPFVDQETERIDRTQVLAEATSLAELIGLIVAIALIPFAFVVLLGGHSGFSMILMFVTQFILAVGSGIVLIYCIARAIQITSE